MGHTTTTGGGQTGHHVSASSSSGTASGIPMSPAPAEVKNGWAYIIRPPRFPIGKTPRQRGGVRIGGTASEAHFVLCAEPNAERIFFLHARDTKGNAATCDFVVEGVPREGSAPPEVTIAPGWFVERRLDPTSAGWSALTARRIADLPPNDPVALKLKQVTAAGPVGGGGGAGGSSIT
jgi:hypothetical protein